jgi:outer membrane lipoprotein carrier protein
MKIALIMFLIISVSPFIKAQDVEDIIEDVQQKYDEIEDLSATFKRIETFKLTGTKSETIGKVFIKGGIKYRFESEDQVVVTDGTTVWTYNSITKQLIIDRVRKNSGALLPRDMLYKYPNEYYSTLLKQEKIDGKTIYVIKLDPKESVHGFIKSMKIWVEDDEWLIHSIETTDLNNNISIFEISNLQLDNNLKDDFFSFIPQEGMQIVDMR